MKPVTNKGTCPKCGGTSFVAKRTKKGVVAAGLLAPKRVRCITCGESLKTGSAASEASPSVRELNAAARARYGHAIPRTPWEWWRRVRANNRRGTT